MLQVILGVLGSQSGSDQLKFICKANTNLQDIHNGMYFTLSITLSFFSEI